VTAPQRLAIISYRFCATRQLLRIGAKGRLESWWIKLTKHSAESALVMVFHCSNTKKRLK